MYRPLDEKVGKVSSFVLSLVSGDEMMMLLSRSATYTSLFDSYTASRLSGLARKAGMMMLVENVTYLPEGSNP